MRTTSHIALALVVAALVAACGERGINVSEEHRAGAEIFSQRCAGCHTLRAAGAKGASTDARTRETNDGPNFNQRKVTRNCALLAIRKGGFASAQMPANIIVGADAESVADFLAAYSGSERPEDSGPAGEATDCPAD